MNSGQWTSSSGGLRGPRHLVEQAEQEIEGMLDAAEEGFPTPEQPGPLITTLLLAEVFRHTRAQISQWIRQRLAPERVVDPRSSGMFFDR